MEHEEWINRLSNECSIKKTAAEVDTSLSILQRLHGDGYTIVIWQPMSPIPCHKCQDLSGQQFLLDEFLISTTHSAPIASHSHPNCRCVVICQGEGLPSTQVDYYGNFETV
jgi:hypothetical protein